MFLHFTKSLTYPWLLETLSAHSIDIYALEDIFYLYKRVKKFIFISALGVHGRGF